MTAPPRKTDGVLSEPAVTQARDLTGDVILAIRSQFLARNRAIAGQRPKIGVRKCASMKRLRSRKRPFISTLAPGTDATCSKRFTRRNRRAPPFASSMWLARRTSRLPGRGRGHPTAYRPRAAPFPNSVPPPRTQRPRRSARLPFVLRRSCPNMRSAACQIGLPAKEAHCAVCRLRSP